MATAVELDGVFSPDECDRIIGRRAALGFDAARIPVRRYCLAPTGPERAYEVDRAVRATERTHLLPGRERAWIFDRLAAIVEAANARTWNFRLSFMEPLQLLAYPVGGHFQWHSDLGDRGLSSLRKVSATVLLSDPASYEGGDLQLFKGGEELAPGRGHGKAVLFPSYQNHRVTPVTRGTRYVLILWTLGKNSLR